MCLFLWTVSLAAFCVYPALCLGLRVGSSRIHCGIPRKPKMQAHCNIMASIFCRHAEVLGSIPAVSFYFSRNFPLWVSYLRCTIMVRQTGAGEIMAVEGGSPHPAAYPLKP
jgi:hypothetical protein